MLGLCFLQELNNLTDQAALDAFSFDIRWQYALDVKAEEAYLSRRSLVEFRSRIVRIDPEMKRMGLVFDRITDTIIDKMSIFVAERRLDSTHIQSNIHTKGRLSLFTDVLGVFLKSLDEAQYAQVPAHIRKWHEEESKGWFGLGTAAERKATLQKLAQYVYRMLEGFREDKAVSKSESYLLLKRLFEEHCEVTSKEVAGGGDKGACESNKLSVSSVEYEASSSEIEVAEAATALRLFRFGVVSLHGLRQHTAVVAAGGKNKRIDQLENLTLASALDQAKLCRERLDDRFGQNCLQGFANCTVHLGPPGFGLANFECQDQAHLFKYQVAEISNACGLSGPAWVR